MFPIDDAIKVMETLSNGKPSEGVYFSVREAAKTALVALRYYKENGKEN